MALYDPTTPVSSDAHRRVHAAYEIAHTAVDFAAALLFVVGSVLFFWESTTYFATWLFVIGSLCFALKPSVKLLRELKFWRMGRLDAIAPQDDRQ
ncbi:MAG: YrhK family protein [Pseudomonadota bacterium]